jgi:hypothetical protein
MNYEWITDGGINYFVVNGVEVDSMCWVVSVYRI